MQTSPDAEDDPSVNKPTPSHVSGPATAVRGWPWRGARQEPVSGYQRQPQTLEGSRNPVTGPLVPTAGTTPESSPARTHGTSPSQFPDTAFDRHQGDTRRGR